MTEEELNYETYKEGYKIYKKATRQTLLAFFRNIPREDILQALKDLKIIKLGYNPKTDEFEWVEKPCKS